MKVYKNLGTCQLCAKIVSHNSSWRVKTHKHLGEVCQGTDSYPSEIRNRHDFESWLKKYQYRGLFRWDL